MVAAFEFFGFSPALVVRRWYVRYEFDKARRTVYEGILGVEDNSAAARKPTWTEVFGGWAKRNRQRNKALSGIYRDIERRLQSGQSLSKALKPYVPMEDFMVIDAGEATNKLKPTFELLLKNFEATKEMKHAIRGAYMNPAASMFGFLAVSIYSGGWLWPGLLSAIPERYWESWALGMVNFQTFIYNHTSSVLLLLVVYVLYRMSLTRWVGTRRSFCDRWLPMYSSYRDNVAAMLLIMLSGLLRAGKTIDQTMSYIAANGGSRYLRWHTRSMLRRSTLFAGDPAKMLNTGLFADEILERINNAAATRNKLSDALQYIGSESIDGVVKTVKARAVIGATVLYGFFAALMFYYTATLVIGIMQASDALMKSTMGSSVAM